MGPTVGVPRRMAEREAGRLACFLQPLAQFQEPSGVLGKLLEAGGVYGADTVVESADRAALRQHYPPVAKHAVFARDGIPAAVFGAEVFGQISHVEELLGEFERVVVGAHDDVRAGADIGRDRRLRTNVIPAFGVKADFDAGLFHELLGVCGETLEL
jgi:hypothetical protein